MSVSLNNVAQVNNTQPIKQPEKKTDEKPKSSTSTKTLVAVGAGLTALATVGIYLATRKKMPTSNQAKTQDIIDEGVNSFGDKFKTIRDKATGNWKERITYYTNGKEKTHDWYNGSISDIDQSVIKKIRYFENGDISALSTYKSGKEIKTISYFPPEDKQKYGQSIFIGVKFHQNGNRRFAMSQLSNESPVGFAKLYDVDGNLIKERKYLTPYGKATGYKLEE